MHDESIQHLFFECWYARFLWGLVQIDFGISQRQNVGHMFVTWVVFDKTLINFFM
jgi:hypothetical protein